MFSSGYLANLAVVTALTGSLSGDGVLIVSDERNHASLVDASGSRAAPACASW